MPNRIASRVRAAGTLAAIGTSALAAATAVAHDLRVDPLNWYYNLSNGRYVSAGVRNGASPANQFPNKLTYGVMKGDYPTATLMVLSQTVPANIEYSYTKRYMATTVLDSGTDPTPQTIKCFASILNDPADSNTGNNMKTSSVYPGFDPTVVDTYEALILNPTPYTAHVTLTIDDSTVPPGYEQLLSLGASDEPVKEITIDVPGTLDIWNLPEGLHEIELFDGLGALNTAVFQLSLIGVPDPPAESATVRVVGTATLDVPFPDPTPATLGTWEFYFTTNDSEELPPPPPPVDTCPADVNADGVVDPMDLALLLGSWGPCPGP